MKTTVRLIYRHISRWPPVFVSGTPQKSRSLLENHTYLTIICQLPLCLLFWLMMSILAHSSFYSHLCLSLTYIAIFMVLIYPHPQIITLYSICMLCCSLFVNTLLALFGSLILLYLQLTTNSNWIHKTFHSVFLLYKYVLYLTDQHLPPTNIPFDQSRSSNIQNSSILFNTENLPIISYCELVLCVLVVTALVIVAQIIEEKRIGSLLYNIKELNKENQGKDVYFSTVVHELRNPLSSILNSISILKNNQYLDLEAKELLELAGNSGDILMSLIGEVLDISKVEAGKLELDPTVCNVRQLIVQALGLYYHKAKDNHLQFRLFISANIPQTVHLDATRFTQVMVNLLGNAIKFTQKGEVRVEAKWEPTSTSSEQISEHRHISSSHASQDLSPSVSQPTRRLTPQNLMEMNLHKQFELVTYLQNTRRHEEERKIGFWKPNQRGPGIFDSGSYDDILNCQSRTSSSGNICSRYLDERAEIQLPSVSVRHNILGIGPPELQSPTSRRKILSSFATEGEGKWRQKKSRMVDEEEKQNQNQRKYGYECIISEGDKDNPSTPYGSLVCSEIPQTSSFIFDSKPRRKKNNKNKNKNTPRNIRNKESDLRESFLISVQGCTERRHSFEAASSKISMGDDSVVEVNLPYLRPQSSNNTLKERTHSEVKFSILDKSVRNKNYKRHQLSRGPTAYFSVNTVNSPSRSHSNLMESAIGNTSSAFSRQFSSNNQAKILKEKGDLVVSIKDTGIGISEEDQKKLFQPYAQANKGIANKYGGTGLGLWITHQIIKLMGGDIELCSAKGQGSAFVVKIPLYSEELSDIPSVPFIRPSTFDYLPIITNPILLLEKDRSKEKLFASMFRTLGVPFLVRESAQEAIDAVINIELSCIFIEVSRFNISFFIQFLNSLETISSMIFSQKSRPNIIVSANWNDYHIRKTLYEEEIDYCVREPISTKKLSEVLADMKVATNRKTNYNNINNNTSFNNNNINNCNNNNTAMHNSLGKQVASSTSPPPPLLEEIKEAYSSTIISEPHPSYSPSIRRLTMPRGSVDTLGLQFVLRNDNQSMKQLSSLSIIIADDDNFSCSTLQKLLKTLPLIRSYGINIIKTENGLACLEEYKKEEAVILVMVDGNMPVMGGFECAKYIRQFEQEKSRIPSFIICISGDDTIQNKVQSLQFGIDDFATKPIVKSKLEDLVILAYANYQDNLQKWDFPSLGYVKYL